MHLYPRIGPQRAQVDQLPLWSLWIMGLLLDLRSEIQGLNYLKIVEQQFRHPQAV